MRFENTAQTVGLVVTEFDQQTTAGIQIFSSPGGEETVKLEAIGAAIQGQAGVVIANLGLKRRDFGGSDVRWIGNDEIEAGGIGQRFEAIAADKFDAIEDGVFPSIVAGDIEGGLGEVQRGNMGSGAVTGDGDGKAAASGAEIENSRRTAFVGKVPGVFGELLSLGAGNQDIGSDGEFKAAEIGGAEQMLEWFAQTAAADEFTVGGEVRFGKLAFEIEVEFHPGKLQDVSEKQFGLKARRIHSFFGEEFRASLDGFEKSHNLG